MPLHFAALLSIGVSALGWRVRALTPAGAGLAALVGTLIVWPIGWSGFAVLGTFFGSSTAVGRLSLSASRGANPNEEIRGARQVAANGGVAALVAPLEFLQTGLGLWLAAVVLAGAAADTWATALGSLSPRPPRDILRGAGVARGASGGVTWLGSSGALVGAALVALAGAITGRSGRGALFLAATGIGFTAMLVDSVVGAAVQARFECPRCDELTEQRQHRCGTRALHRKGWRWLDNDAVNLAATAVAAMLGALAWQWASP